MNSQSTAKNSRAETRPTDRPSSPGAATQHMRPAEDLLDYFRDYARERPEVVALWCLGIGFVLGWKLKPW